MPRDACKEGAPEWAIASAGVAAMKVLIFSTFISKKIINWAGSLGQGRAIFQVGCASC